MRRNGSRVGWRNWPALIERRHGSRTHTIAIVIPSPLHARFEQEVLAQAERLRTAVASAARPGAADTSPLQPAVAWMPYGPDAADACVEMAADLGAPAAEYSAIRRGVGVLDGFTRGTLRVRGTDRVAFLQRMVTQDLKDLKQGEARESFWLNRKGRVQADLLIAEFGDEMLVDLDRFAAAATVEQLRGFLFSEDVQIEDVTGATGRLALHGAAALVLLQALGLPAGMLEQDRSCAACTLGALPVRAVRRDLAGVPGIDLFAASDALVPMFDTLLAVGLSQPVRAVGWHAFNVARIEGGSPLFLVDFGREALPHETGVLARRVSFRKGCYLGQEVVARMESLGKPKQRLVGVRMQEDRLPVAGAEVHVEAPGGEVIGAITSSGPAPMLGSACVAFAMLKYASGEPGTRVRVAAEGDWAIGVVQPGLRFLPGGTP
jgi:folate-binding protein YgfZ